MKQTKPIAREFEPSPVFQRIRQIVRQEVFTGEIYENHPTNEHLKDFLACHFHRKILRDAKLPTTRRQGLRAANQIGKTRIGECIMVYRMEHEPAHMVVYDETIEKSRDHMANRFGPLLKSIPSFGKVFKEIMANNRFDVTTQDIRLPGMVFRARPLNEQWTQSITVKYGMISDAALCDPRQIRRAFVRSRQHEKDDFWFVESQGDAVEGQIGGGFKEFMETTDEEKLWVRCPACQTRVRFKFGHTRNEETKIVAPLAEGSLNFDAWISHHRPILLADDRRHCGFKVEGELKKDDGTTNEQEIMRATVYECPHCASIWRDDGLHGATRRYLDREAGLDENWIATRPDALPGHLGYSLPVWINQKISWGSAMLFFRQAIAAKKGGVMTNLQEWRTKWEGEDWDEKETMALIPAVTASVDQFNTFADGQELFRSMEVDCQKDKQLSAVKGEDMTGHFWVTAWATDIRGNDVQLWRGYCTSWDEWIAKQKELGIPVRNVSIDISYKPDEVKAMAARHAEIVCESCGQPKDLPADKKCKCNAGWIYSTWMMMRGSAQNSFRWDDGNSHEFRFQPPELATVYDAAGGQTKIKVPVVEWSNFRFKSLLDMQRRGEDGMPELTVLPDDCELLSEMTRAMERMPNENYSWDKQMNSEMPSEIPGKKPTYVKLHKENHYRDCCCMQKVRKLMADAPGIGGMIEMEAEKEE